MSCCGRNSAIAGGGPPDATRRAPVPPTSARPAPTETYVVFEYMGRTGMTVIGGVSGRRYRFDHPGARTAIDPVDRRSLAGVPHLRRVNG